MSYNILKKLSKVYDLNGDKIRALSYYTSWFNINNNINKNVGKSSKEWMTGKRTKIPEIRMKLSMKHLKYLDDEFIKNKRKEYLNGKIELNKYEKIILDYYEYFKDGVTRNEIDDIKKQLNVKNLKVLGSYSRNSEKSNDIDILVWNYKNLTNIIKKINKLFPIVLVIQKSNNKFMGIIKYKKKFVHIDIINVDKKDLIPSILYFTGPKLFNVMLRNIAKKKGYKLTRYGLFKNNKSIKLNKEEDIFKILDLPYIPINKR